ncbi:MAG: flagellar hook-associated protein FlgL [Gammaproteobacteria bacterium]|nr:flagellar hook-associated protein FlgL [Gammaproteobacteria bacterium]
MRVSTNQINLIAMNSILDQQTKVARTQEQLSTGKRILHPSDDPTGASALIGYRQTLDTVAQYQENITSARQRLQREESALGSVGNILDRIRELALQSNNSALSAEDRRYIAVEVRQNLDEIMTVANATDANGEYIFAGYQGRVLPFSRNAGGNYLYSGDSGQRFLQIGSTQQVATGDSGDDVFMRIRTGNGTFSTGSDLANRGDGVIASGSVTDPSAYDGDVYTISFPHATTATGTLSFTDTVGTNDALTYTLNINGVDVYSVSEGGTPAATLDELAQQINDDSAASGARAVVADGTLYLVSTAPSDTPIVVTESMSGASDGDADAVTGYFGSVLTGATATSAELSFDPAAANYFIVEDSRGNLEASGAYSSGVQVIAFNGIQTSLSGTPRTGDVFTVSPSGHQDLFSAIDDLASMLEGDISGVNASGVLGNSVSQFLSDIDQGMENIRSVRAQVGARLNRIDTQENMNEASSLQIEAARSSIEDLDYTSAITQLTQQTVGLQAAQKVFIQVQGLSLFNYL